MSKRAKAVDRRLASFYPIARAIALLFQPNVEVVVHDLRSATIAFIANPISKRKVGEPSADDQFTGEVLHSEEVIGPYRKVYKDGRSLRSVSVVLRDEAGQPHAVMCMNFDVTPLHDIAEQLKALAFLPGGLEPSAPFFHDNWRQSLERMSEAFENQAGVALRNLDVASRGQFIQQLEDAGLLSVRNAPAAAAERLGISRALFYRHLKDIREGAPLPRGAQTVANSGR